MDNNLFTRYPTLTVCRDDIEASIKMLEKVFYSGGRLYVCGNGGSAADALHIVGELAKSFVLSRPLDKDFMENINDAELRENLQGALPAFPLVENVALSSAFSNDANSEFIFAQQVYAYARKGDCVLGISTSGNSKNIINALKTAKGREAYTIGLTGQGGGEMKTLCNCCICVPETETYLVQELHLPIYHAMCLELEKTFFGVIE